MSRHTQVSMPRWIQHIAGAFGQARPSFCSEPDPHHIQSLQETQNMITVFPNPVTAGASVNIGCDTLDEGYYDFQLLDPNGRCVQHKRVWIDAGAGLINLGIGLLVAGQYVLVLSQAGSRKKFSETILINSANL
jgi:hypothetical protein